MASHDYAISSRQVDRSHARVAGNRAARALRDALCTHLGPPDNLSTLQNLVDTKNAEIEDLKGQNETFQDALRTGRESLSDARKRRRGLDRYVSVLREQLDNAGVPFEPYDHEIYEVKDDEEYRNRKARRVTHDPNEEQKEPEEPKEPDEPDEADEADEEVVGPVPV